MQWSTRHTLQEALYCAREEGAELTVETVPYQHIELTHHDEIDVVPQAKAKHGELQSPIEGPEDLETELGVSLAAGYEIPTNRLQMHMPHVFPQGAPHVRYPHLVTIHPRMSKAHLAQTLWEETRNKPSPHGSESEIWDMVAGHQQRCE